jgi:hypothetical protein
VQGFKALEYFRTPDQAGALNISVASRFCVNIDEKG